MPRTLGLGALSLFAALISTALVASPAGAATPAEAAYRITSTVSPTHLLPGDDSAIYVIRVVNSGGASTDGSPIVVGDELPEGIATNPEPKNSYISSLQMTDERENQLPCQEGAVSS